jgi:hypothetical protein
LKNLSRQSIRYYVYVDEQLFRLRSVDHFALINGELKLQAYANSDMRIIEIVITKTHETLTRSLRGLIHRFTSDGTLDVNYAADAISLTLRSNQMPESGPNVVSLVPELDRRAWDARHTWEVDRITVQKIDNDLLNKAKLPTFKFEK